jgi:ribonuclease J
MHQSALRIFPLGGLGEIGMNCMCLEYEGQAVLIDCGIQFPSQSYPGVDFLVPDLDALYDRVDNLLGVVVTHGHDDHIGAIPFLRSRKPIPVYCTPFPQGLLENKLAEYSDGAKIVFHEMQPRKKFKLGPFTFDPIPVQHSIIESVGLAIETPVGVVIHTGDFKHDEKPTKGPAIGFGGFREYGDRGVELLLSDSTNAERRGHTMSESEITASFERIFREQTGRLLVALFASNIRRVESLVAVASKLGKKVAFAGRSMHNYTQLAQRIGAMDLPEDTLIHLDQTSRHRDDSVVVLLTGSQAEPQAALVRIAQGTHKDFKIRPGDTVVLSSRFIPGNERNITAMINELYRQGAEVLYESFHQIHVSGHGCQDELKMMLEAVRPRCFVPIHGEYRHLAKHAKLAEECGVRRENIKVIEDGQVVELDDSGLYLSERVELKKVLLVDGHFVRGDSELFQQRLSLSRTGVVFAVLVCDDYGELLSAPRVYQHGLLFREGFEPQEVLEDAIDFLERFFPKVAGKRERNELLRVELRRFFKDRVSMKPLVIVASVDA